MGTKTNFSIRPAVVGEEKLIIDMIKSLAEYEKCLDEVIADEQTIHHSVFVEKSAEVIFAEENGTGNYLKLEIICFREYFAIVYYWAKDWI